MEGRTCWGAQCTVDENESVSHFRITFFILFFLRKHAQNKRRVYLMASTQVRSACNSRSRAMFLYCGKTIWISRPLPTSNTANSGSSHFLGREECSFSIGSQTAKNQPIKSCLSRATISSRQVPSLGETSSWGMSSDPRKCDLIWPSGLHIYQPLNP